MLSGQEIEKCKNLLNTLVSQSNCVDYEVAVDFAVRAFQKIPDGNVGWGHCNFNLYVENCPDRIISDVLDYYLLGKGKKERLVEDVFPIINALSRNTENAVSRELRQMFYKIYR